MRLTSIRFLKYTAAYTIPLTVWVAFTFDGWLTFLPLGYSFGFIPLVELGLGGKPRNISAIERELVKQDPWYDYLLYAVVPMQYFFLAWFILSVNDPAISTLTLVGRIVAFGLLCGVMGINVAHELGHRRGRMEKTMAKMLLLTSLYPHFYIEHNFGHHRNVATPEDPASARYGESLFSFWLRSISGSYRHAWRIQRQLLKSRKRSFFSFYNDMLWYEILKAALLLAIGFYAGLAGVAYFCSAALIGIVLLETVNYIEHYGLERRAINAQRYENTRPVHSWNSDHWVGRLVLFELTRHSDHHAHPHKHYPLLDHFDESPQLPTGYPGMMLLSALPPLWFKVMNRRCKRKHPSAEVAAD